MVWFIERDRHEWVSAADLNGALAVELCVTSSLSSSEAAAWTQSVAAIISLIVAVGIGWWQGSATLKARKHESDERRGKALSVFLPLLTHMEEQLEMAKGLCATAAAGAGRMHSIGIEGVGRRVVENLRGDVALLDAQIGVEIPSGAADPVFLARRSALSTLGLLEGVTATNLTNSGILSAIASHGSSITRARQLIASMK